VNERPKWTDVAIVILTVGIVFFAFVQWREMVGTGQQTDKLIDSAKRQNEAAESKGFARQSQAINGQSEENVVLHMQRVSGGKK